MLNVRHLRVFNEVCKHMNMTRASEALFISQPAISKTILEIEEEYGIHLFERWNKALYLTADGKMFQEYAREMVSLFDRLDANLRARMWEDDIRVGASITAGTSILGDIITAYQTRKPKVRMEAVVDNTDVIERLLVEGKLDIAIVEGEITNRHIMTDSFGMSEIVLVVNKEHPLYNQREVRVQDLDGMDFIVREKGSRTRERFAQEMETRNLRWNALWSCHNTQAIKNAVDAGLGIGVLSKLSVRKRLRSGRLWYLNVFDPPILLNLKIAYHANKFFTENLTDFKQSIIQTFDELNHEGKFE